MKQLWMRLGAVAGILGVGGAGVLVAQRSGTTPEGPSAVVNAGEDPTGNNEQPRPIPLTQSSLGAGDGLQTSPVTPSGVSSYSNELPLDDSSSSARFVGPPSSPQYSGSSVSYSVNDSESDPPPSPDSYADSAVPGNYDRPGVYAGDYATETPPATTGYSGRYGDAVGSEEGALRSPQEFSEPAAARLSVDSTGEYGTPTQPAPMAESAPNFANNESYEQAAADPPRYVESGIDASKDVAGEPASLRPDSTDAPSRYSPAQSTTTLTQPQSLTGGPLSESPSLDASYASIGSSEPVIASSALASDTPGARNLEGAQTPMITLEKLAPSEVSVGQVAPFKIIVHNVGEVTAHGVVVTDRVPQGTKLVDASPEFSQTSDGAIAWQLGDLDPGDQTQVSVELMPLVEGEIGSVAQVTFLTQASVRTVSTKPELVVKHTGPDRILVGEDVVFEITLSNPGSGATTGIVVEEDVPVGLAHVAGEKLEYEVGTLRPKEEKRLQLVLRADKAGVVQNVLRVKADAGLETTDQITLEVIAPELQVAIGGPRTRYLERQVAYQVEVANPGTSTAYDIELVTFLPKGLQYISADNKGSYDSSRHAVYWSLAELPAQESGSVQLTALPIETGEQKLIVEGTANSDLSSKFEHTTTVEALTELAFNVQDVHDPIEVGSETTYEIRITNNGNKVATNVQIAAAMPEQLRPISGEGPTKVIIEGQQLFMEPLARIAPRDEVVYRIAARGVAAGDHVIAVQLASDEVPTPVTKQESTKVYADQ